MKCQHDTGHVCVHCRPDIWMPADWNVREATINMLVGKILSAKAAYYAGKPTLRDEEYDALETSLRAYAPDHPALAKVGSS